MGTKRARGAGRAGTASRVGLLTVGETARILGVSPSTLRLWESVGLVTPVRSDGRYRLYSSELLDLLKRIKYLRDVKRLNFPGIRDVLDDGAPRPKRRAASHATDLGARLRKLRKRAELPIAEAARRAKISPGFLSAIEGSVSNPSVATLQRLTAVYGSTVLDFYDLPRRAKRLLTPRERRSIQTGNGVRMEMLAVGAKQLQSMIFHVPPGAGSDGAYSHEGEEFIYMLTGTLEIWLDELECHTIRKGDSFWFESTVGHRWFNPSDHEAVLLWVNTPLTF
jgi:DNA-binding transcriptional MerR regulator/quercetin dioxygenase-like cupin family protein